MNTLLGTILLAAEGASNPIAPLLPMIAIFVIFYFLLIRPQQKRQKEQDAMLQGIEKKDRVMTAGGLWGTVLDVTDAELTLEIGSVKGERMRVKVGRHKIESVEKAGTPASAEPTEKKGGAS